MDRQLHHVISDGIVYCHLYDVTRMLCKIYNEFSLSSMRLQYAFLQVFSATEIILHPACTASYIGDQVSF